MQVLINKTLNLSVGTNERERGRASKREKAQERERARERESERERERERAREESRKGCVSGKDNIGIGKPCEAVHVCFYRNAVP